MSFLNPVNEPVLRFSGTDASAPQINYNSRTAGDVKEVLKACLVTGYGSKASAGWSIANEVGHVAEFVSPSAAMSDYRLGISDASASSTTWYYQYQDVRVNPNYNAPIKEFASAALTNAANSWQLFVTERGILFVELVQHSMVNKLSARITYWGAVKSGVDFLNGRNICFFNVGHSATILNPYYFYSADNYVHTALEAHTSSFMSSVTSNALQSPYYKLNSSVIDLVSAIYLTNNSKDLILAGLPPLLSKIVNATTDLYGVAETTLDGRSALSVCAGRASQDIGFTTGYARTFLIPLDYWEY